MALTLEPVSATGAIGATHTVTATLTEAATAPVVVELAFTGSATAGSDFTASATQIEILPGATSGTVTLTAVDDALEEPDETIVVEIVAVTTDGKRYIIKRSGDAPLLGDAEHYAAIVDKPLVQVKNIKGFGD